MELLFFCPRWGATDPWEAFCDRVKGAGYDGVEASFPLDDPAAVQEAIDALRKFDLRLVGQYWQSLEADFDTHRTNYERHLRQLIGLRPLLINCQTGKDYFTFEQNQVLFERADRFARESGIPIYHETHRNKALFAAHVTAHYLHQLPYLHLTADFSHWCCVHESFLDDQPDALALACAQTRHIHTRVGYAEGPQVPDPRAPEWQTALEKHLHWWDTIVDQHRQMGAERLTLTTEFGPPDYLHTAPYTQEPVASQWDINVHMKDLLRDRYR